VACPGAVSWTARCLKAGGGVERRRPGAGAGPPNPSCNAVRRRRVRLVRLDLVDRPLDVQVHAAAIVRSGARTDRTPPICRHIRNHDPPQPSRIGPTPPQAHRRSRRHRLAGTATVQAQTSLVRGASVQRLLLATAVHKRRRSTWSRQLKDAGEPSHRGTRSQPVRGGVRGAGPLYGLQQPAVPGQLGDQRGDPGADGRPLVHPRAHSWHRLEPVSLSSAHLSAMSMPAARRTVQRSFATFQCVNVTKGLSSGPTRGRLWPVGGVRAVLACCCEMSCSCVCAVLCWCCRSPG